jgi:hypothetical protein
MRKFYVAVALALCSTSVLAADFGLGVSAKTDDGIVYLPIDISKSFRIEPSVRYASSEYTSDDNDGYVQTSESKDLEAGIGVFGLKQVTDAARIYFGARAAYVDSKNTLIDVYTSSRGVSSRTAYVTDQDGYRIGPTVGFEYLFGQHFSVGGEAGYTFYKLEGDSRYQGSSPGLNINEEREHKTDGSETRLVFRYMF